MLRLILFFFTISLLSFSGLWLIDNNANLDFQWFGYQIQTTIIFLIITISIINFIIFFTVSHLLKSFSTIARIKKKLLLKKYQDTVQNLEKILFYSNINDQHQLYKSTISTIKNSPNSSLQHLLQAENALYKGDYENAKKLSIKIKNQNISDLLIQKINFIKALHIKDYELAKTTGNKMLEHLPSSTLIIKHLLDIYQLEHNVLEQKKLILQLRNLDHINTDIYDYQLQEINEQITNSTSDDIPILARIESAQSLCSSHINNNPNKTENILTLANLFIQNNQLHNARNIILNQFKIDSDKRLIDLYLSSYNNLHASEKLKLLKKLLKLNNSSYDLYIMITNHYIYDHENLKKASLYIEKARAIQDSHQVQELLSVINTKNPKIRSKQAEN